jgi:hypothetical protein
VFSLTDLVSENVAVTARDTTDGVTLTQKPVVQFVVPPAVGGGLVGGPPTVDANGTSNATILVTLKDSLGRGTPGKIVTLVQGSGQSVISGPSVTDNTGQIQFTATDVITENVVYTATDVTDGNLPVPGSVTVDFANGAGCSSGSPTAAPGYSVSAFAAGTGFVTERFFFGDINFGCDGAYGLAFDPSGNVYVPDIPTGNIYKFPPTGGVADKSTLLTATPLLPGLSGLAFDKSGHLFAARSATTGDFFTGDIVQLDPSNGTIIREVASGLTCPQSLAADPISDDLFAVDGCTGAGSNNSDIWRISDPGGPNPTTTVYGNSPGTPNYGLTFAPDGTFYMISQFSEVVRVTGTSAPQPPTVTIVSNAVPTGVGLAAAGEQANGDAEFLLFNQPATNGGIELPQTDDRFATFGIIPTLHGSNTDSIASGGLPAGLQSWDLTSATPGPAVLLATGLYPVDTEIIGPDGCLYSAAGLGIYRFTDANGNCIFPPKPLPPAISLTPLSVSPNPLQGTLQSFTATFHYAEVPAGTPVFFSVDGANHAQQVVDTNNNGQASFSYSGISTGTDNLLATATVNKAVVASNPVQVTWEPGLDTTFLTLNLSPKSAVPGEPVTLTASLSDISKNPAVLLVGEPVTLGLGSDTCGASTDANGNASCEVNPQIIPGNPSRSLTADFAGTADLTTAHAATGFTFTAPVEQARLRVRPKVLHFGAHGLGTTSEIKLVRVFNPTRRKRKITITFLGAENTGDFTIISGPPTTCDDNLAPKQRCDIALFFSPTAAGKRKGTLVVDDNAERNEPQKVKLRGVGLLAGGSGLSTDH